jgi:nucleoid-associated protein YgaU
VVAGVLLVLALVGAFAFTAMRGGIDLAAAPGGAASPEPTAPVASAVPSPTVSPRPTVALPSPVPTTFPSPTVAATQPATPLPTPQTTPTPSPADPRYAGLRACPDRPGCYLYVVRRGDTLSSIAASFGVPLRAVRDLNEDLANPSIIRVGQKIRVPGPG